MVKAELRRRVFQMSNEEKIRQLEAEVDRLKQSEKVLMHDLEIYKQIFKHLSEQFEELKRSFNRR
ncbi:hypothetical protein JXB31_01155 [Candidatus Woesearchaeota archaeon]|nr:hypothetical protein [Candidatus Woesearchaeota archaeon]